MAAFPDALAPLEHAAPAPAGTRRRDTRRWLRWLLLGGVLLAAAVFALRSSRRHAAMPEGLLVVNGRLEGDNVNVAGKQAGRIERLLAREGDTVAAGQELVRFDDATLRTREAQARAALDVAERRVTAARVSLEVARQQVTLDIRTARATLAAAQAALDKAVLAELQARRDDERAQLLLSKGGVEQQQAERATLASDLARAEHASAAAARERALRGLDQAQLGADQLRAREAELAVLEAAAAQAAS
jgi:HlyD family secretion protein